MPLTTCTNHTLMCSTRIYTKSGVITYTKPLFQSAYGKTYKPHHAALQAKETIDTTATTPALARPDDEGALM